MSVRWFAWAIACTLTLGACDDGGGESPDPDSGKKDAKVKKERHPFDVTMGVLFKLRGLQTAVHLALGSAVMTLETALVLRSV